MKTFRVYFNRKAEAPQVWSVDEGTQASEINVKFIVLNGCHAISQYNGTPVNTDMPSAWFEISAMGYRMKDGGVHFF